MPKSNKKTEKPSSAKATEGRQSKKTKEVAEKKKAAPKKSLKEKDVQPAEQEVVKKIVKRKPQKKDDAKQKKDSAAAIENELKDIYEEEGEMPDMTRLERRPRRWWIAGILTLLLLGAIVAVIYAGWTFWKP